MRENERDALIIELWPRMKNRNAEAIGKGHARAFRFDGSSERFRIDPAAAHRYDPSAVVVLRQRRRQRRNR